MENESNYSTVTFALPNGWRGWWGLRTVATAPGSSPAYDRMMAELTDSPQMDDATLTKVMARACRAQNREHDAALSVMKANFKRAWLSPGRHLDLRNDPSLSRFPL